MGLNTSLRRTFAVVDELGVDPLRDVSIDAVLSVERWNYFEVDDSTEFNLPLIAQRFYGEANWWWVILVFNGITDAFYVKRGTRLKMPVAGDIVSALSTAALAPDLVPRVIDI